MRGPQFELMEREEDIGWVHRYLPLSRKLGPMPGRARQKLVAEALARVQLTEDWLPLELAKDLPDTLTALRLLHDPPDESEAQALESGTTPAHRRLASEELFAFALGVVLRRAGRLKRKGLVVPTSPGLRERLKALLPFHLTGAQRRSFKEIVEDLTSGRVMNRLLQGDVGSGKTLVALLSMAMVAETGGQGALLVPTEVLARQHAESFRRYLGDQAGSMQLLLGGMKAAEKRGALARIASGEARYVVGTHALFQEAVAFHKLQLVVVDEQHRFGVKQREALKEKGGDPHWLVMSATPIPGPWLWPFSGTWTERAGRIAAGPPAHRHEAPQARIRGAGLGADAPRAGRRPPGLRASSRASIPPTKARSSSGTSRPWNPCCAASSRTRPSKWSTAA